MILKISKNIVSVYFMLGTMLGKGFRGVVMFVYFFLRFCLVRVGYKVYDY